MTREEDAISRESLRQKLQEHHDFFVNAYGGFSNLPRNDKSRVDEISTCIAMVVNEPSIQPKTGHWINDGDTIGCYYCSECCGYVSSYDDAYCKYCGAKMVEPQEDDLDNLDSMLEDLWSATESEGEK